MRRASAARALRYAEMRSSDRTNQQARPVTASRARPQIGPRGYRALARLTLGELLAAASLAQAHLLALDLARIARDQACFGQDRLEGFVVVDQSARDAVTNRAGLTGLAATVHVDLD